MVPPQGGLRDAGTLADRPVGVLARVVGVMEAAFSRVGEYLVPADEQARKLVASLRPGQGVVLSAKRARNIGYHRRFFALLRLAFDYWEPTGAFTHAGQPVRKDFDRFREDVLILAGQYRATFGLDGSVRLEARSISFAAMGEDEFRRVYRAVFDVLWDRVLSTTGRFASREQAQQAVEQLLAFEPA